MSKVEAVKSLAHLENTECDGLLLAAERTFNEHAVTG